MSFYVFLGGICYLTGEEFEVFNHIDIFMG